MPPMLQNRTSAPPLLAPVFFGVPSHRFARRVLELEPVLRAPGSVARAEPLRHDAFEAHLAGVPEYALAIVGEVLVQTQTRKAPTQPARERRLAMGALRVSMGSRRRSWPSSSSRSKA